MVTKKRIYKDCDTCEHYNEPNNDRCDSCHYPDFKNWEIEHTCENCEHCTGSGLFDCNVKDCRGHNKWSSK